MMKNLKFGFSDTLKDTMHILIMKILLKYYELCYGFCSLKLISKPWVNFLYKYDLCICFYYATNSCITCKNFQFHTLYIDNFSQHAPNTYGIPLFLKSFPSGPKIKLLEIFLYYSDKFHKLAFHNCELLKCNSGNME